MSDREPRLYLEDIRDAIGQIEKYTESFSFEEFVRDRKTIDAVVRNLSVIGEAVRSLPEEVKGAHPEIPWIEIMGMRNKVIHEYFAVDEEVLWNTVKKNIPQFKSQIEKLFHQ